MWSNENDVFEMHQKLIHQLKAPAQYVSVTLLFDCGCKLLSVPHVFLFDSQKSTRNTDSSNSPDISLALAKAFRHSFLGRHFWYLQNIN